MKRYITAFLFVFVLLLTAVRALYGQSGAAGFAINPKLGVTYGADYFGGIAGIELNGTLNQFMFSVDYFSGKESIWFFETIETYHQLGIMFGRYEGVKLFRFQYQAGVAPAWGIERGDYIETGFLEGYYEEDPFSALGLALKLGFKLVPLHFLSVGIDLQANISAGHSVFMPLLSLEIGMLRDKNEEP
jgi:hypothetical protein